MILSCAILGNRRQNKTNSANVQSYSLINCLSNADNCEIEKEHGGVLDNNRQNNLLTFNVLQLNLDVVYFLYLNCFFIPVLLYLCI